MTDSQEQSFEEELDTGSEKELQVVVNPSSQTEIALSAVSSEQGSSWYAAVFLIINAALGAGLLDFPQAFDQTGGILTACSVQLVILAFVVPSLLILAYCAEKYSCSTYQEVVYKVCGPTAKHICSFIIVLYCYGTCITFLIIIGDLSDRCFSSLYGTSFCHLWYMQRDTILMAVACIIMLPMCFSKKIDFLKYPSSLGVIAAIYLVCLVIAQFYTGKYSPKPLKTAPDKWEDVFNVVPVICFGYQCHVSCVPVLSCLRDRRMKTYSKSILTAIFFTAGIYTAAAIYAYRTFGTGISSDVLQSYDAKDASVLIGIITLALKIVTTYPILLFCGRSAVEDLYVSFGSQRLSLFCGDTPKRLVIIIVWFISSVAIACLVPNIGVVIHFIGSLAAVFIFVFPGLCFLKTSLERDHFFFMRKTKLKIVIAGIFITFGMFILAEVIAQSIINSKLGMESIDLCV